MQDRFLFFRNILIIDHKGYAYHPQGLRKIRILRIDRLCLQMITDHIDACQRIADEIIAANHTSIIDISRDSSVVSIRIGNGNQTVASTYMQALSDNTADISAAGKDAPGNAVHHIGSGITADAAHIFPGIGFDISKIGIILHGADLLQSTNPTGIILLRNNFRVIGVASQHTLDHKGGIEVGIADPRGIALAVKIILNPHISRDTATVDIALDGAVITAIRYGRIPRGIRLI